MIFHCCSSMIILCKTYNERAWIKNKKVVLFNSFQKTLVREHYQTITSDWTQLILEDHRGWVNLSGN